MRYRNRLLLLPLLLYCGRSRGGSLPAIRETELGPVSRRRSPDAEGTLNTASRFTAAVTLSSSSSSSGVSDDNLMSAFDAAVSPKPSVAVRHLIRSAAPPSHVTIRTGAGVVHLATIPASVATADGGSGHVPTPPPSGTVQQRPLRTGSAQRFRKMVLQCRDGD